MAADDECLGPEARVRVGCVIAEHGLGWPWLRNHACSSHERPLLMGIGLHALRRFTFCPRPAVVFRPLVAGFVVQCLERESNPRQTTYQVVALPD